jgi:hypothetical protein
MASPFPMCHVSLTNVTVDPIPTLSPFLVTVTWLMWQFASAHRHLHDNVTFTHVMLHLLMYVICTLFSCFPWLPDSLKLSLFPCCMMADVLMDFWIRWRLLAGSFISWHALLADTPWTLMVESPCLVPLSISICTQRQHGQEAVSFVVNFHMHISFETYLLSLHCCLTTSHLSCDSLIEKSGLSMFFGDTSMRNFTSRTFGYHSQHF